MAAPSWRYRKKGDPKRQALWEQERLNFVGFDLTVETQPNQKTIKKTI